jgi:hypothetical protein
MPPRSRTIAATTLFNSVNTWVVAHRLKSARMKNATVKEGTAEKWKCDL